MAEVSIDKVALDSVLAKDVLMPGGALLMGAGTTISEHHIAQLRKRGIRTVCVDANDEAEAGREVSDNEYAQRCERLDTMFAPVSDAPHMNVICEAARVRLRHKRTWE